jgi:hypothetical protein
LSQPELKFASIIDEKTSTNAMFNPRGKQQPRSPRAFPTSSALAHVPHSQLESGPRHHRSQSCKPNNTSTIITSTYSELSRHVDGEDTTDIARKFKMPSAKFTETYEKVSKMGEKLKAAGKQGPSNDEQLNVRLHFSFLPLPYHTSACKCVLQHLLDSCLRTFR